jgi:hypothetical protein
LAISSPVGLASRLKQAVLRPAWKKLSASAADKGIWLQKIAEILGITGRLW